MRPFYFGENNDLFGIYRPAQDAGAAQYGVVICNPFGQEYIRAFRALRQCALQLSRRGYPVLRFDYYGSGDSRGNGFEGSIELWLKDISSAADELRSLSSVKLLCLLGLRFGSTLAWLAAMQRSDVHSLVLWEPILDGTFYLRELRQQHRRWLLSTWPRQQSSAESAGYFETVGFPMTNLLQEQLKGIDLSTIRMPPVQRVLLISATGCTYDLPHLSHTSPNSDLNIDHYQHQGAPFWTYEEGVSTPLVPVDIINKIISWLATTQK